MRLLRCNSEGTLELTDFLVDNIPQYAILSHTWSTNNEEINFDDLKSGNAKSKPQAYRKISLCGERAQRDGLTYFWVDTCCIDKSSSAELQEAITTMFSWYQKAARCYVYMNDVLAPEDVDTRDTAPHTWDIAFRKSRWFTRGWTLQELLAPSSVEFFSARFTRLGDKHTLEDWIHDVTQIPREALQGCDLAKFSVEERLSWARNRQTTRREDKAYSLLGIFHVFMPLMYGEGEHAFSRLREEIDKTRAESANSLHWISKLPIAHQAAFNSFSNQHGPTCLPDTRIELLSDIRNWVDGVDKRGIFWLNGIAGTGKSTVARTMARLYYDRGNLGGSFFFSRGGGDAGVADRLFTTLASQLASRIPQVKQHICKAIIADPDIGLRSLRDQWDQLIIEPLSKLDPDQDPSTIVFVIDALDECGSDSDIRIILRLLASTGSLTNLRLRIFITSRPEIPVRCGFQQIPQTERQCFVLQNISPTIVDRDLSRFFEHSFMVIREERGFAVDWPGSHVIRRLVEISCGLFIWASTACRFIREGKRLAARRISTLINYRGSGAEPEKHLDEIYITVLKSSIQQGYSDEEKQELQGILRQVLGSIVVLRSPLSLDALSNLIPLSPGEIEETLADLHTVFHIPAEASHPIRLHHPTFRDFILHKERCRDLDFWVDEEQAHEAIANNCIQLMSKMLKRNICSLGSPGTTLDSIDSKLIETCISPELRYACVFWVYHYRKSSVRLRDGDDAPRFFQHNFHYWLEVMILLGKVAEVAVTIRTYASLLIPEESPDHIPFVHDARRFFFAFQSVIETAPLQIYCSAIVFGQRQNALIKQYGAEMHQWIREARVLEANQPGSKSQTTKKTFFVNNIKFTPDKRYIASGSTDPEVRLWDVATKATHGKYKGQAEVIRSMALRTDGMKAVAISPDGQLLASGSDDAIVTVWRLKERTILFTFTEHASWVNSVAFSGNGKLLASGSMDETVRIWDMETGKLSFVFQGNLSCIHSVAFSPDNSLVASSSADQLVRLWDIKRKDLRFLLDGHSGAVNSVDFSSNGKRLVSGSDDKTIKIWETATATEFKTLRGHDRRVLTVAFSPNAEVVASGSEDRTIKIWDAYTGDVLATLCGHEHGVNAVIYSPDGQFLASSSFDVELRLWNARSGEPLGKFDEHEDDTMPLSTEKQEVLDQSLDPDNQHSTGHSDMVICVIISQDGNLVGTGSHDGTIKLWSRYGESRGALQGHSESVACLLFSPDGLLLASASSDKTLRVWDVKKLTLLHTCQGHSSNIRVIRWSLDGEYLASCSTDKTAMVWCVRTGEIHATLQGHLDTVTDVVFSPMQSSIIATCSADSTVRLWDLATGVSSRVFAGHSDTVNSVAFSLDGKTLISCSADTTLKLWDAEGAELAVFKGHTLPVNCAALSFDNKFAVSCSDDETIRVWNLETGSAYGMAQCGTPVRNVQFIDGDRGIETERGCLSTSQIIRDSRTSAQEPRSNIFATKDWLTLGGENMLWLPHAYQAISVTTFLRTAVLGHATGGVSFLSFP